MKSTKIPNRIVEEPTAKPCKKCGTRTRLPYAKETGEDHYFCSRTCWETYRAEQGKFFPDHYQRRGDENPPR